MPAVCLDALFGVTLCRVPAVACVVARYAACICLQGMDSVNERLLFKQIMQTCGKPLQAHTGPAGVRTGRQYFVISPKLLPELAYERCVRVHIVNSGVGILGALVSHLGA